MAVGGWRARLAGMLGLLDPRRGPAANLVLVAGFVLAILSFFGPELVTPSKGAVGVVLPSVLGKWEGPEQANFQTVLQGFQQQHRITVNYQGTGDELPETLKGLIQTGHSPDVAILPQSGLLHELVNEKVLKTPLDQVVPRAVIDEVPATWRNEASVNGKLYGVYVKAANQSMVWYRPSIFRSAHIAAPPRTFADLLTDMAALERIRVTPFANCGASGWPLVYWFENMYVQVAGPTRYRQLAKHAISWTDSSVTATFQRLSAVFTPATPGSIPGVMAAALPYPDCMNQLAGTRPAAMVLEGDFAQSTAGYAQLGGDVDFFPFPAVAAGESAPGVVGGDVAVMIKDTPEARELIQYLASPQAGETWAKLGGFISPNTGVPFGVYPNETTRRAAEAIVGRRVNSAGQVFDLGDEAPSSFGANPTSGLWGDLYHWLANPADTAGTEGLLEGDASIAYSSGTAG